MQLPDVFDHVPTALWWADITELNQRLVQINSEGIADLGAWFRDHQAALIELAASVEILRVNPSTLSLLGFESEDELKAQGLGCVFTEQTLRDFGMNLVAVANNEVYFAIETESRDKAGRVLDVLMTQSLFPAADGRKQCLVSLTNISPRKDAERKLQTLVDELEDRVQQRTSELAGEQQLLKELLEIHERDRRLVAYEIHDGFVQQVASAIMHSGALQEIEDRDTQAQCDRAVQLLEKSVQEARHVISGLRPPVLDDEGLVAAVHYLIAEHFTDDEQVDFEFELPASRMAPILENNVFRIIQEALVNARRHSQADQIKISVNEANSRLLIDIRDNGRGFDPCDARNSGVGLRGIRERSRLFGGVAQIESTHAEGTHVHVELPVMR